MEIKVSRNEAFDALDVVPESVDWALAKLGFFVEDAATCAGRAL